MSIERIAAILSAVGLLAALFAPAHQIPVASEPGLTAAGTQLSMITMYPLGAVLLASLGGLAIGLALADRLKLIVFVALAATIFFGLLVRSVWQAKSALASIPHLGYENRAGIDFAAATFDFQWGWIAMGVSIAVMLLAGALAWMK
jgi:hypothetical protein